MADADPTPDSLMDDSPRPLAAVAARLIGLSLGVAAFIGIFFFAPIDPDRSLSSITPLAGNRGNGAIVDLRVDPAAPSERWTIRLIEVETFSVVGAESGAQPEGRVGEPYDNGAIAFTVREGERPFQPADSFAIAVNAGARVMAALAALIAIWWMTEAIPLSATALLPVALFPIFGVMSGGQIAGAYIDRNIMLFLGGFLIALAMERWNLHKRIALVILRAIGGRPSRLVLGFMIATAFLSMWISNTATAMMMLPMGMALILLYEELNAKSVAEGKPVERRAANFPLVLMLSIAYSASIGGIATKIGTPPNVVFARAFEDFFPGGPEISFFRWMVFALPLCVVFLFIAWFVLSRMVYPLPVDSPFSGRAFIEREARALGTMSFEEKQVLAVFATTAALWIFRTDLEFSETFTIAGWPTWLERWGVIPDGSLIDDGTISILMGLSLFILPARRGKPGERLMNWETAESLPWGILILLGGGFALAEGFEASGLSRWVGDRFVVLQGAPTWVVISTIAATINGVTELTSNTATTTVVMPILASLARAIEVNPLLLMIPATLSASCAFMLPIATPPNAIVFGSRRVPIGKMIKAGIALNLIGLVLIAGLILTVGLAVFQIDPNVYPAWAAP
jgi:sodium-dependent dicarboxylate transporter 2/3/5